MSAYGRSEGQNNTKDVLSISGQGYATAKDPSVISGAQKKGADAKKFSLHDKCAPKFPKWENARTLDKREYIHETKFRKTDRVGYGGGFKIPEEYRKKREARRLRRRDDDDDSSDDEKETNAITKEEIIAHLNLGDAQMNFGSGKANSKGQLTKDLVEGLEKELEKLKRSDEHYRMRMRRIKGDKTVDETEKDVQFKVFHNLEKTLKEDGGHIQPFGMREEAVQLLRHQPGQLKSVKNEDYEALEKERKKLVKEAKRFEEELYAGERTKKIGSQIRKTQGYGDLSDSDEEDDGEKKRNRRSSNKKRVRIQGDEDDEAEEIGHKRKGHRSSKDRVVEDEDNLLTLKEGRRSKKSRSRSRKTKKRNDASEDSENCDFLDKGDRSKRGGKRVTINEGNRSNFDRTNKSATNKSRSRSKREGVATSPRRTIYEAKFEKFVANKSQKEAMKKRVELQKKTDFDITTRNQSSPSRWRTHFVDAKGRPGTAGFKIDEDDLMPEEYEDYLVREDLLKKKQLEKEQSDPFKELGVSKEDKMTFFLLKWVFNAIRQPGDPDDIKLKGKDYIDRKELVRQLAKNTELMHELEFDSSRKLWKELQVAAGKKPDLLTWDEYLDFFFLRTATYEDRIDGNDWWNKVDKDGKPVVEETPSKDSKGSRFGDSSSDGSHFAGSTGSKRRRKRVHDALLQELEAVKMTPALQMLIESRKAKTVEEVEADFNAKMDRMVGTSVTHQKLGGKDKKKKGQQDVDFAMLGDADAMNESLGFTREKSKNLLLPSQVHCMKEIYESLDKYDDKILQRSNLIMKLRTDERVVDFVDAEAVQVAGKMNPTKILTLDQVLAEIERDEMYERMQLTKGQDDICHKEFITWREFLTYFDDYREVDERNKKAKQIGEARKNINKPKPGQEIGVTDPVDELKNLMEEEKARRLKELPRIRPADMIDISEEQLKLIRTIYEKQLPKDGSACHTITFFAAIRKSPQMKAISSAVARDPQGHARMPRETFQQVFDRMERDIESKHIEWTTIVEFFTKRGKPLSKEEIQRLQAEDQRLQEEQEEQIKKDAIEERRKLERMNEDNANHEDFDAFAKRQNRPDGEMGEGLDIKYNLDFPDDDYDRDDDLDRSDRSDRSDRRRDDTDSEYDSEEDDSDDSAQISDDLERADETREQKKKRQRRSRRRGDRDVRDGSPSLREQRLRGEDFDDGNRKKGKYGVTVPQPFAFDGRDLAKPKTIRERKVEAMVKEKQAEEEAMLQHRFQCKPIPPEVSIPRYDAIMEANDRRRENVRRNSLALTKNNERPFSFWDDVKRKQAAERDPNDGVPEDAKMPVFKANPIPIACSMSIYKENLERETQEREQRIRRAAEISKGKSKYPARMQRDMDKKSQIATIPPKEEFSFKPKINESLTAEQMKKKQQKFADKLEKKKTQFTATQPSSPKFSVSRSKPLERSQYNEGGPASRLGQSKSGGGIDPFRAALAKDEKAKSLRSAQPASNPPGTKGYALLQDAMRKKLDNERKAKERQENEDKARVEKQRRLKATVQAGLKGNVTNAQTRIDEAAKQKREDWKHQEKANKQIIADAVNKGRSSAMLTDSVAAGKQKNLAIMKATQNYLSAMDKVGISRAVSERTLTVEQKEAMREEAFVAARKGMYKAK